MNEICGIEESLENFKIENEEWKEMNKFIDEEIE